MSILRANLLFLFLLFGLPSFGQSVVLDQYIQEALESNITLQREQLSYQKSLEVLQEAKAMFLPQLSVEARYSLARGGRQFEIPAGDLVNPAYQNLNVINSLGQSTSPDYPAFPTYPVIENQSVNFLRKTEHETLVRMAMPVFNNAILRNHQIRQNQVEADRIGVDIYRRELVKEVKTAYFNYQKAEEAFTLFNNTLKLVEENLRTTESLFRNHKVTKDAVYLAEAQVKEVMRDLADAEKNKKVAQAFFNFLLNRSYESTIERSLPDADPLEVITVDGAREQAWQNREELEQLSYYLAVSDNAVKLQKGNMLPNVNLALDYGFQGTRYSFTREDDFFMGSLVMSWKLFQQSNRHKVQQAKIEKDQLIQQKEEVRRQIGLQVVTAWYDLEASVKGVEQARAEVDAARKAFELVRKKHEQGQANQVEIIDARTRMTNAQNQSIIARYDQLAKIAELERMTGTYNFSNN